MPLVTAPFSREYVGLTVCGGKQPRACLPVRPSDCNNNAKDVQEKCYFGDMENPVADVAAQAAAALALISRLLVKHGNPEEVALGGTPFL